MPRPLEEIALRAIRKYEERVEDRRRQREAQKSKDHEQRLAEIRSVIKTLKGCCRQQEFRWPDEGDLERLHDLVSKLVRRIRKRPAHPQWKRYKAVDDYWHLQLWQTVSDLVERAASNSPQRPLENYAQELTSASLGDATETFFSYYREVVSGRRDPSQIKWEQFDELFTNVTGKFISRRVPLTDAKSAAHVEFLKLFCADQQWVRKNWKGAWRLTFWIASSLQHPQMLRKLTRFLIPEDGSLLIDHTEQVPKRFAEEKKKARRAKDRDRKRRK